MNERKKYRRSGYVYLDTEKIERQLQRCGYSNTEFADEAEISRGTVVRIMQGKGVYRSTAQQIAQALGVDDATCLLQSDDASAPSTFDPTEIGEWKIERYEGRWIRASNGLQYRICLMRHRFVQERLGRGKWYDMLGMPDSERREIESHLLRHPTVCERICQHTNIVENLSATPGPDDQSWWVIDRWHAGLTLAEHLESGCIPKTKLPRLMRGIAEGLKTMHASGIVFRELAPRRVLIAEHEGRAILTDFELAKLLDSSPTVSKEWPDDPYRAPEVKSGKPEPRSDLYSWARILTHVACGELPVPGEDAEAISRLGLPKAVWKVATDCLAPGPSGRPANIDVVLKAISRWK